MKRFQKVYSLVFALLLTGFTVYALLDSFVIRRVYTVVEQEAPTEESAAPVSSHSGKKSRHSRSEKGKATSSAASSSASVTDTSYDDGSVSVMLTTYRVENTDVYVADVVFSDPAALQTAFAQSSYGRNVTADTSDTASSVGAILAVNGDNYGSREKGYVIRNGVLYRDTAAKGQEDLVVYADGSFAIVSEDEVTAQELLDAGAVQVFSFGPGLLEDGEITVGESDEVDMAMTSNPRTAIAQIEPGHILLVVSDGRTSESEGLTLYELAQFLQSLGADTAYNLDGGGSSTMVFLGQVVNNPTSGHGSGERAVTDIVYF